MKYVLFFVFVIGMMGLTKESTINRHNTTNQENSNGQHDYRSEESYP